MTRPYRGLSNWQLLGLGLGAASLAVTWGLYNIFMPLLLRDFVKSSGLRGAIMGIDNVLGLLLVPIIGAWSDRIEGPLGKRMPFLLVSMPLAALLFAALPFAKAAFWTLMATDIVFLLAMTAFRAPLAALMPDHVAPEGRSHANAVLVMLGAVGGALGLLLLAPLSDVAPWFPFTVAGAVTLAALFTVWAATKAHPEYVEARVIQDDAPVIGALIRDAGTLLGSRQSALIMSLMAVFLAFFGYAALEAQFSTFATEEFGLSGGSAGVIMGITIAGFVVMALPAGQLAKRFSELRVMRAGTVLLAAWLLIAAFVAPPSTLPVWLGLGGVSWALVLVPAYPLIVNHGGDDHVGFYTGMYYLFGAAASIVAPAGVGWAMDVFGNGVLLPAVAVSMALAAVALSLALAHQRSAGGAVAPGRPRA